MSDSGSDRDAGAVGGFEERLQKALDRVKVVLDATRAPRFASRVHHSYQDKYLLTECLTNSAAASHVNCLVALGLSEESIRQARAWSDSSAVSLQFRARETCQFLRKETRQVESATKHVQELSMVERATSVLTSKNVTTVEEWLWDFQASYSLDLIRGVGAEPADRLPVLGRTGRVERRTRAEAAPAPEVREPAASFDVNISWLIKQLNPETLMPGFQVDRSHPKCYTPLRNPGVQEASELFSKLFVWTRNVSFYLKNLLRVQPDPSFSLDVTAVNSDAVFIPVLPLFHDAEREAAQVEAAGGGAAAAGETHPVQEGVLACLPAAGGFAETAMMAVTDSNRLLEEEVRSLRKRRGEVAEAFPSTEAVATAAEAMAAMTVQHCMRVCEDYLKAVQYIEGMLRTQLIAAIGKEVTPADFAEYMRFHSRKLFGPGFLPIPFCFSVRRSPQHSPEGTVSIEECVVGGGGDSGIAAPIVTVVGRAQDPQPMKFALNASATLHFEGERFLHAYLSHKFSGQSGEKLSLVARARQFSSMLVLVGRITSRDSFDPKYAAIVQNKDELTIPLELATIPTPQEFRDAIESLSPEQQAFAKAFRSMQLESTLFGVLVIQIKPQLERVLNLPQDTLTKEIKLTQELMELFIRYQIPSDLLSFDPDALPDPVEAASMKPMDAVRKNKDAIQAVIAQQKEEEIKNRQMEREYQKHDRQAGGGGGYSASHAGPAKVAADQAGQRQHQEQRQQPQQGGLASGGARDYTQVPTELEQRFGELEPDNGGSLRPTIIKLAGVWQKNEQKALLAPPTKRTLHPEQQKEEKDRAYDLLDALTKSGAMPIKDASLHIVVAATHCFDKSVLETVVQDNCNPIDKVERSTLIMASTVHQLPPRALIQESQFERLAASSPMLFVEALQA